MKRNRFTLVLGATALAGALACSVAAQQPGAPGAGRGGARGGFGRGGGQGAPGGFGRGGGQGRGMGRQLTVANVPTAALQKPLSLSADQVKKITDIQTKNRASMQSLFPQGGFGGGGFGRGGGRPGQPGGAPPGRPGAGPGGPGGAGGDFQQVMEKVRAANEKATKDVEGVLTPAQKAKLPELLKQFQAARAVQFPLEVVGDLKLTADQTKKIQTIADDSRAQMRGLFGGGRGGAPGAGGAPGGDFRANMQKMQELRQASHQKAVDVLTPAQKETLKKYEAAHPQQRGGFGGRGRTATL